MVFTDFDSGSNFKNSKFTLSTLHIVIWSIMLFVIYICCIAYLGLWPYDKQDWNISKHIFPKTCTKKNIKCRIKNPLRIDGYSYSPGSGSNPNWEVSLNSVGWQYKMVAFCCRTDINPNHSSYSRPNFC